MSFFVLFIIAIPFYSWLGVRSWQLYRASQRVQGEHAMTLQFLALNLAEPLLNTPLVAFLYFIARGYSYDDSIYHLFVTLPMALLAVPIPVSYTHLDVYKRQG